MSMRNTGTKGGFEDRFPGLDRKLGIVGQAGDLVHLSRLSPEVAVFLPSGAALADKQHSH